jgi:acetolactate decarboxylase
MLKLIATGAVLALNGCALPDAGEPHSREHQANPDASQHESHERWDGSIHQWGTVREVLKEDRTQPRVDLRAAADAAGSVGVGAIEGLQGEVTILDGRVWLARDAKGSTSERPSSVDASATLLTVAYVPKWLRIPIDEADSQRNLDKVLRDAAQKAGTDIRRPFPFIIEGRMTVEAHVIRGQCPHGPDDVAEPVLPDRFARHDEQATLVGFYAESAEGILTHHGSATHVHVVMHDEPVLSGHVDSVRIAAGAFLRLPAGD